MAATTALFVGLPLFMLALPRPGRWHAAWQWTWHGVACFGLATLAFASIADHYFLGEVERHIGQEVMTVAHDLDFLADYATGPAEWGLLALGATVALAVWVSVSLARRGQQPTSIATAVVVLLVAAMAKAIGSRAPKIGQHTFDAALGELGYRRGERPFARDAVGGPSRSVVVFLLESWSAKYVDTFSDGKPQGVTLNMDRLAREGIAFTNFYSSGQRSFEGVQAVLAGLPSMPGMQTLTEGLTLRVPQVGRLAARREPAIHYWIQSLETWR